MSQCTHTQMGVLWHAKLGTSLQIACSLHSCSGLHDGHLKLEKDARPDPTKHSAWRERAQERGGWSPGQGGTDDRAKHTKALPQGQHYHIIQAIPRHGTASKQQDKGKRPPSDRIEFRLAWCPCRVTGNRSNWVTNRGNPHRAVQMNIGA